MTMTGKNVVSLSQSVGHHLVTAHQSVCWPCLSSPPPHFGWFELITLPGVASLHTMGPKLFWSCIWTHQSASWRIKVLDQLRYIQKKHHKVIKGLKAQGGFQCMLVTKRNQFKSAKMWCNANVYRVLQGD